MKKLIKRWDFEEGERRRLILGNGVRLEPSGHLVLDTNALGYLTADDLSAKTWLTTPRSSKRWIGFESYHETPLDELDQQVTSIGFRLSRDGTEELYWDGLGWAVAAPGEWNTEAEVASNIQSLALSVTHRGLQVIINLATTDPEYSPRVFYVKALYESDVEWLEDILVRSLKTQLEANLRPVAEAVVKGNGTATVTLNIEASYTIDSIDTVYNLTADPEKLTNIFSAYNSGTRAVTLTTSPANNANILIRFKYRPEVTLMPSQDIVEIAKTPCVGIGDIRVMASRQITCHESVINKLTGQGWRLAGGEQMDIEVPLVPITSKEKDAHRLSDEIRAYFKRSPLLTLYGTDEKVRILILDEHSAVNVPNTAGSHGAKLRAAIMGAVFYNVDAEAVTGVLSFQLSGTINVEKDA